jgi:hypothetical protein
MSFLLSDNAAMPLFTALLRILKEHPEGIREYELMKRLAEESALFLLREESEGYLELFRSHFFLFHLLYRLQDRLIKNASYRLSIFCLEIKLFPYHDHRNLPVEADPLREYYLDMDNMLETEEHDVRCMLSDFFKQLDRWEKREDDLQLLGLPAGSGRETVRREYRQLVQIHHPDKGGDPERFREINEAARRVLAAF